MSGDESAFEAASSLTSPAEEDAWELWCGVPTSESSAATDAPEIRSYLTSTLAALTFTAVLFTDMLRRGAGPSATGYFSPDFSLSNSTDEDATVAQLRKELGGVLSRAGKEEFRDGLPSTFAQELHSLVADYGRLVVTELQSLIADTALAPGIGSEALVTLSKLHYTSLVKDRADLIEMALASNAPEIRYGAALALAGLQDTWAVPALDAAIIRERVPALRDMLRKVRRKIVGPAPLATAL